MKKKILMVDDEPEICQLVSERLTDLGYAVTSAHTGQSAWAEIEKDHPDLIILDIFLPDKDGVVIFEELRQNPQYTKIPVIFLTALAQGTKPQLAGVDEATYSILPKPTNLEEVELEVARLLR